VIYYMIVSFLLSVPLLEFIVAERMTLDEAAVW